MMFCKHNWKLLSTEVTKSEVELLFELLKDRQLNRFKGFSAERKHIQVFTCDKCGKLKRFVEDI